ncbi:hypothetical protein DI396_07925 [Litorivita pollutaquae]|uniref:Uncharacterized protein n=1 Tax=Litorivita pollutaquae TaxID=2200892 RepID=A0A2V4MR36_9RHOB|nr:hypothetical protein DI396_07925 [Litorivita pollutaquae]
MEPLKRDRTGRQQKLTLAQVPVNAGGQAIAPNSVLDQKAGDAADIGAPRAIWFAIAIKARPKEAPEFHPHGTFQTSKA